MKTFRYSLDESQMARMTSAIRTKKDIILLWMRAIKIMTSYQAPRPQQVSGEMMLHVGKMSRLFFSQSSKIFTVNFPFVAQESGKTLIFKSTSCPDLNNKVTSDIISLISAKKILNMYDFSSFCDSIIDVTAYDDGLWSLIRDLLLYEEGYLRFDHDICRENGKMHPIDHIDIFYSGATTFKLGLNKRLTALELRDIIDITTECHFISKP